ncbi:hypothetical protein SERLA73DRAFT_162655 [Serpula lacrymans var. lacrymans S7.3]|uniref:Class E vacuolar protein-sorting machinery protein HSE1 n=2 Tax=Serpula lacrymans var. lacrymans TaxID=341189 RepID=F8Q910_SERL3|nr:uncharacterized protein SERLADRAFT_417769 [Serpula lacrymans var. lacrymans S7.9]EGN95065.1 hypothetical protein SERLA73DRAFT_162655 [Serpula lacrymans var. lacrymans S7.3]EGO20555.1 hypothetical protein SERLADRAFT_417769 [Serpula lacrymans var. lacrymans S7.9]
MFKGGQANPYDEIVGKTTDENLTSENWELILNLCDKVQDEGEQGARNVIAAVLKRMTHRSPNVQLYALSLAESLSKNCGVELHRELASRAYTQALEKLITDRTTHEKVRRRALSLIALWTAEFEKDPSLGIMEECYNNLKAKNYKFEVPQEPPPPTVDDEVRRREEEELQRVLEMSVRDKGGRNQWAENSSSSGAGGSGSGSSSRNAAVSSAVPASGTRQQAASQATYHSGYVPARTPSPKVQTPVATQSVASLASASTTSISSQSASSIPIITRVRAMHTFEPTEPGELAFEKGDVIKVVDRGYKDWWRGQLKGRTGIFPVNYVEHLPEPTAVELAKEAEQEAAVFAQTANIDRLLTLLRSLDPAKDNLADNEEIQELYRSSMSLRPKIVKLIDKYSQKRADLVSMNETFVKARSIFDRMMEESLARHSGMYDPQANYRNPPPSQYQPRPDSRARQDYAPTPQGFAWNPAAYDQNRYGAYPGPVSQYPEGMYQGNPQVPAQSYGDHNGYTPPQPGFGQPYGIPPTNVPYGVPPSPYPRQQPIDQSDATATPHAQPVELQAPPQQLQYSQNLQPQVQAQAQVQTQPQQQAQSPAQQSGPPYVYDPNGTYADPNVQAWAAYYAQGGNDKAGAVYFISVPGVTDDPAHVGPEPQHHGEAVQAEQSTYPSQDPVAQLTSVSTYQDPASAPIPSNQGPTFQTSDGYANQPSPPAAGQTDYGAQNLGRSPSYLYHRDNLPANSNVQANQYVGAGSSSPHSPKVGSGPWVQAQQINEPAPQGMMRRQSVMHSVSAHAPLQYSPQGASPSHQQQQYMPPAQTGDPTPVPSQYAPQPVQQPYMSQSQYGDNGSVYAPPQDGRPPVAADPGGEAPPQGWQSQYHSLHNQFSGMRLNGERAQGPQSGQQALQGVGAPA